MAQGRKGWLGIEARAPGIRDATLRDFPWPSSQEGNTESAFKRRRFAAAERSGFLRDWNDFALSIEKAVPAARFMGPDTGSNYPVPNTKNTDFDGESWTQRFADDEKGLRPMPFVTQHDYVGEDAKGVGIQEAIDAMLSPDWIATNYRLLYEHVLAPGRIQRVELQDDGM